MVFKIFYRKITAICNAQHHSTEGYLAESIQSQTSRGSRVVIFWQFNWWEISASRWHHWLWTVVDFVKLVDLGWLVCLRHPKMEALTVQHHVPRAISVPFQLGYSTHVHNHWIYLPIFQLGYSTHLGYWDIYTFNCSGTKPQIHKSLNMLTVTPCKSQVLMVNFSLNSWWWKNS